MTQDVYVGQAGGCTITLNPRFTATLDKKSGKNIFKQTFPSCFSLLSSFLPSLHKRAPAKEMLPVERASAASTRALSAEHHTRQRAFTLPAAARPALIMLQSPGGDHTYEARDRRSSGRCHLPGCTYELWTHITSVLIPRNAPRNDTPRWHDRNLVT